MIEFDPKFWQDMRDDQWARGVLADQYEGNGWLPEAYCQRWMAHHKLHPAFMESLAVRGTNEASHWLWMGERTTSFSPTFAYHQFQMVVAMPEDMVRHIILPPAVTAEMVNLASTTVKNVRAGATNDPYVIMVRVLIAVAPRHPIHFNPTRVNEVPLDLRHEHYADRVMFRFNSCIDAESALMHCLDQIRRNINFKGASE